MGDGWTAPLYRLLLRYGFHRIEDTALYYSFFLGLEGIRE